MKKQIITMLLVAVTLTTIPVTNSYATVTIDKTAQDEAFMRSEGSSDTESLSDTKLQYGLTLKKNQTINLETENVKSISIKSDNPKAVVVKGSKVICYGGSAYLTMRVTIEGWSKENFKETSKLKGANKNEKDYK